MGKYQEEARILANEGVADATWRLVLECPRIAAEARPGQFVMLQIREGTDPLLRRPFSFHRIHAERAVFEILYRVVGRGTWWLSQTRQGSRVSVVGPLGNAFRPPDRPGPVAVVGGGIGVAQLYELLHQLAKPSAFFGGSVDIHFFYGTRTAAEMLPESAFSELNLPVHRSTDDGTAGFCGTVVDLFRRVLEKDRRRPAAIYACGSLPMQFAVAQWALSQGIPAQLSLESLMACGLGACLGCALPAPDPKAPNADRYVRVCKDGPIFEAGSIRWNKIQPPPVTPPTFVCV
jgi:dihydroorotate dehydrogenase electron transfer subunit